MGIVNKFEEYQMETFMEQHGDRITPVYGRLLSVKIERKRSSSYAMCSRLIWLLNQLGLVM